MEVKFRGYPVTNGTLQTLQVMECLADAVAAIRARWQERELPRLRARASKIWGQARQMGGCGGGGGGEGATAGFGRGGTKC